MSATAHFAALATGLRPQRDGLLGNARCEWQGVEIVGEEAILASFARAPFVAGSSEILVATPSAAAWIGSTGALVADVYDGRLGRLWRLGPGETGECAPEPRVDVAFDPDLRQARGEVLFRPEDHPDLEEAARAGLLEAASQMLADRRADGALRARGFVVRAFGASHGAAALVAVHTLSSGSPRAAELRYAALGWARGREPLIVLDPAPPAPWTPRL